MFLYRKVPCRQASRKDLYASLAECTRRQRLCALYAASVLVNPILIRVVRLLHANKLFNALSSETIAEQPLIVIYKVYIIVRSLSGRTV